MQEHQSQFQELLNLISVKYPIIGFGISFIVMILGVIFPDIHYSIWDLEIPKIIMQLIQLTIGVGGFAISIAVFIKNKKNKK